MLSVSRLSFLFLLGVQLVLAQHENRPGREAVMTTGPKLAKRNREIGMDTETSTTTSMLAAASTPTSTSASDGDDIGDIASGLWDAMVELLSASATCPLRCGSVILAAGQCGFAIGTTLSVTSTLACMCNNVGDSIADCSVCVQEDSTNVSEYLAHVHSLLGTFCKAVGQPFESGVVSDSSATPTTSLATMTATGSDAMSSSVTVFTKTATYYTAGDASAPTDSVTLASTSGAGGYVTMLPANFTLPSVAQVVSTSGSSSFIQTVTVTHEAPSSTSSTVLAAAASSQNPSSGALAIRGQASTYVAMLAIVSASMLSILWLS